LIFADVTI